MTLSKSVNTDGHAKWLDKYPGLFQQTKRPGPSLRPRFDFGKGWDEIVDSLLWCIEWTLIVDFHLREQPVLIRTIREHQGSLDVDFAVEAPWAMALVRLSNARAQETCEVCGQPGRYINTGWPQVRCGVHRRPRRVDYLNLMSGTD